MTVRHHQSGPHERRWPHPMENSDAIAKGRREERLRAAIELATAMSGSYGEFESNIAAAHVGVALRGRHLTYTDLDTGLKVRDTRLGPAYDLDFGDGPHRRRKDHPPHVQPASRLQRRRAGGARVDARHTARPQGRHPYGNARQGRQYVASVPAGRPSCHASRPLQQIRGTCRRGRSGRRVRTPGAASRAVDDGQASVRQAWRHARPTALLPGAGQKPRRAPGRG